MAFFHCKSCAFRRSKPHYCQHTGFRGFLWVGSSCWEEVTLFHCKNCAFIRSKPRYCQTHWFQTFFCGLAHHVGKRWPSFIARAVLSVGQAALLPNTLVSDVFCGLAHHVGKRWLSFIARAVLSLGRSRANAKHIGFRCFLWVGSSCWEEVTDSLSFPHGILMVYHLISMLSP